MLPGDAELGPTDGAMAPACRIADEKTPTATGQADGVDDGRSVRICKLLLLRHFSLVAANFHQVFVWIAQVEGFHDAICAVSRDDS